MDWKEIEKRLCARAEEVVRHLLPHGKREGAEWVCGDIEGHPGRSLKVNLGGKVGVWADFAGDSTKTGKTLISLWCSVAARPFRESIVKAKEFLGIADESKHFQSYSQATNQKAAAPVEESSFRSVAETWAKCQPLTVGGPVWNYLVRDRFIEPLVLTWFDVREMLSFGEWVMVFPFYAPARQVAQTGVVLDEPQGQSAHLGSPTWLKFEKLNRPDGKKKEWTTPGPEKCLFGAQLSLSPEFGEARAVLICEGEKDVLTWATYGCATWGVLPVSVPFGAKWRGQTVGVPSPNRQWLDRCADWLEDFETVFVAMDSDEPGRKASADIINEIGPRRCRLVELPERPSDNRP